MGEYSSGCAFMAMAYFALVGLASHLYLRRDHQLRIQRSMNNQRTSRFVPSPAQTLVSATQPTYRATETSSEVLDERRKKDFVGYFFLLLIAFAELRCTMFFTIAVLSTGQLGDMFHAKDATGQALQNVVNLPPTIVYCWMTVMLLFVWYRLIDVADRIDGRRWAYAVLATFVGIGFLSTLFVTLQATRVAFWASDAFFVAVYGLTAVAYGYAAVKVPKTMTDISPNLESSASRVRRTAIWFAVVLLVRMFVVIFQYKFSVLGAFFLPVFYMTTEFAPTCIGLYSIHCPGSESREIERRRTLRLMRGF